MPNTPLLLPLQWVGLWIAQGRCTIQDRDDPDKVGPLVPNFGQRKLYGSVLDSARRGVPVRKIVLKARKMGISTECQAINFGLCSYLPHRRAKTYAHSADDVAEIFGITKLMAGAEAESHDDIETGAKIITFDHGSNYQCRTARSENVGRGGTPHFVHASEWASLVSASGLDAKAGAALLNAVGRNPSTIIILESTGAGPFGDFWQRVQDAMKGIGEYELVFLPWYEDERYRSPLPPHFEPTDLERQMMTLFGLSAEQIQWYRTAFTAGCGDGQDMARVAAFKREFPTTPADAFLIAEGRVYPYFSDAPPHVREVEIGSDWERWRAIDWGESHEHPMVCLWIAHNPKAPPGLTISHDCTETRRQFLSYARDPRTGAPIKREDDTCLIGDTNIITSHGTLPISELVGTAGELWTPLGWQRYHNCRLTQKHAPVWKIRLADGDEVTATESHKFLTLTGFHPLRDLTRSDIMLIQEKGYESARHRLQQADIQRKDLPAIPGAQVLQPAHDLAAQSGVGLSQGTDPEGLSCSPSRQEHLEQPDSEPQTATRARSRIHARLYRDFKEAGTRQPIEVCYSRGPCLAQERRRSAMAQPTRQKAVEAEEAKDLHLPDVRQGVHQQEVRCQREVLSPELQDDCAAQATGRQSHLQQSLPLLRGGVPATEDFPISESDSRSAVSAKAIQSITFAGYADVYDISVDVAHCFTLPSGIIASNCDALRYYFATRQPTGHVHVYRELFDRNPPPLPLVAKKIHEMSGWKMPERADPRDYGKHMQGQSGERYATTVADRSRPKSIESLSTWGLGPACAASILSGKLTGRGEIEDGIMMVSSLMCGQAYVLPVYEDVQKQLRESAEKKDQGFFGRPRALTADEEEAVRRMWTATKKGGTVPAGMM